MKGCVFCELWDGQDKRIFFKNSVCYVIADRLPVSFGHLLVIPNKHYADMFEAPDDVIAELFKTAKAFGTILMKSLTADGINLTVNNGSAAGQDVFHLHVHVIPRYSDSDFSLYAKMHREEITPEDFEKLKAALSKRQ